MKLPQPERGLVIRYSYLWRSEAETGRAEGRKDRPCVIVLAVQRAEGAPTRVVVVPITHSPPTAPTDAVELPPRVSQGLGLDHDQSWIVVTEVNVFTWPGPDLRPAREGSAAFGRLPHGLLEKVRQAILMRNSSRLPMVERDER